MKALIQRVGYASVEVEGRITGSIEQGLLVLLGVEKGDTVEIANRMLDKLLKYRVFSDQDGKMNCSLEDVGGGLLLVSQFTLAADTRKGLRPSFSSAAPPEHGKQLYDYLVTAAQTRWHQVATGEFGADMKVSLMNDGPVTFLLEVG